MLDHAISPPPSGRMPVIGRVPLVGCLAWLMPFFLSEHGHDWAPTVWGVGVHQVSVHTTVLLSILFAFFLSSCLSFLDTYLLSILLPLLPLSLSFPMSSLPVIGRLWRSARVSRPTVPAGDQWRLGGMAQLPSFVSASKNGINNPRLPALSRSIHAHRVRGLQT